VGWDDEEGGAPHESAQSAVQTALWRRDDITRGTATDGDVLGIRVVPARCPVESTVGDGGLYLRRYRGHRHEREVHGYTWNSIRH